MIATILPGSADFHAVGYNEHKVSKGLARLIEMRNFGTIGLAGRPTTEELTGYLKKYSSTNSRIRKPQFHVAVSCKGREMTESELLDFAHRYLKEMGYAEPGQPWLIYAHHDTDNTHLHIITSRVAPDGRKIAYSHERRRSQEVIDRILGTDRQKKIADDMDAARQYTFSSFAQFKAIMVYKKDENVFIKHGGKVQRQISLSEIEALFKSGYRERSRCRQLRSILKKYRDVSGSKEGLQKELKEKFGIDLVFFGRKDAPYGYMIVDHAHRTVINGARVLATELLLDFATPEQRFARIEDYIDRLLTLNPKITQGEIFQKLRKQRAYIKKGVIHFDGQTRPLKPFMADAIDRNNRIRFIEMFHPATEAERDLLCKIFKVNRPDLVDLSGERPQSHTDAVSRLHEIFNDENVYSVRSALHEEGFIIREEAGAAYAVNFNRHIVIDLAAEGLDTERLKPRPRKQQAKQTHSTGNGGKKIHIHGLKDSGAGSHSEKREWEVGGKGGYDDIDDGRNLKR